MLPIQAQINELAADLHTKHKNKELLDPADLARLTEMRRERDRLLAEMPEEERLKIMAEAPIVSQKEGNGHAEFASEPKAPNANELNVLKFLKSDSPWSGHIWYDTFRRRQFTDIKNGIKEEWTDSHDIDLLIHLQGHGLPRAKLTTVQHAVDKYTQLNLRNEPRDWMDSLTWDGQPRIADFFMDCMGAERTEDNSYIGSAGHNFWVSLAARIYAPGCQLYNMVVIEGSQGIGKTSALKLIGGPWYTEAIESIEKKDFFMTISGKLLVEISELESFRPAEVTRIKQIISNTADCFRDPYTRRPIDHPRSCVFVGTTNEETYLRDATGGRRFWPLRCGKINLPKIENTRNQLFAEAVWAFKSGEGWHFMPEKQTLDAQESRREEDTMEDTLRDKLSFNTPVSMEEIRLMLGITPEHFDRRLQLRVGNSMRQIGYIKKVSRNGDKLQKKWFKEKP